MATEGSARVMGTTYDDTWFVNGARTGFADYTRTLALVPPTDLGIKAGRAALERADLDPSKIDTVIAANLAQAAPDAYLVPRHIGLYSGVPLEVPALLVQRLCGSGFETVVQAADAIKLGKASAALCVGTESMSRNPIVAYEHRTGFKMGQVQFMDFLWEALKDPAAQVNMGDTAENLAERYQVTREEVDAYAEASFDRAIAARDRGFHAGEIVPVVSEAFEADGYGYAPRGIRLPRGTEVFEADEHVRPSPMSVLAKLRPSFRENGVQTGGNSSAIVDGAAGAVVASGAVIEAERLEPLARVVAAAAVGVPPEIMGIGPAPAIRAAAALAGLAIDDIGLFEVNEAFGAQVIAVMRETGIPHEKLNVNGGAIAIGHPLAATGVRCLLTLARAMRERGVRWGVGSACIGGGQGIAVVLENVAA